MARRRDVAALLAVVVALLALQHPSADLAASQRRPVPKPPQVTAEEGLRFRLSEAGPETGGAATPAASAAPATPISDADADRLLSRLPPPSPEPGDVRDWAIRDKSLPPPRAGATVRTPFPPPERPAAGPPDVEKGPLRVLRRSPEGDVPIAPHLSVSFSQPMVAVTSHEDTMAAGVPVRIDPQPAGRWRWVGTKTLLFEPEPRFPMATTYTVQVPAGTRSATGGVLAAAEQWTFRTPPPSVTDSWPKDIPVRRRPVLIVVFDQKVDPAGVLSTLRLEAAGRTFPVRVASAEEIQSEEEVARRVKGAVQGYAVAVVPQEDLPPDTGLSVVVGPGTPSAEGPRRTEKEQSWGFQTYGRLKVVSHNCGWGGVCRPLMPWHIQLSNPIDAALFKPEMVRVTPALPAIQVDVHGNALLIRGRSKGRTTYKVTLGADLPDTFGQTLGAPATVAFEVGPAEPTLSAPGGDFVVLDPAARPRFSVFTINQRALRVTVNAVGPEHWDAFHKYRQERYRDRRLPPLPGRAVFTRTVQVTAAPDELTETAIDLAPALPEGTGQLLLLVEPVAAQVTEEEPPATSRTARAPRPPVRFVAPVSAWVQVTRIGLHAMVDNHEVISWTSALADGRPLSGARVRLLPGGAEATTGPDGLARLPLADRPARILVAQSGRDLAILPDDAAWWSDEGSWREWHRGGVHRFFVFDDRHLYRPGETVKAKGYIRSVGLDEGGDVEPWVGNVIQSAAWFLKDSQGNDVAKGVTPVNRFGAFDVSVALPATMNLGTAQLLVRARDTRGNELHGHEHAHAFEVQEFRRPEFEVDVQGEAGPHLIGTHTIVTATASYFAGGSLGASEVTWNAAATPGTFRPPNRDDFTFGTWVPWWMPWSGGASHGRTETLTARTDAAGRHRLQVDFDGVAPPRPSTLRVEATVMDVNRQAWTDGVDLLVHPASIYVGLKTERPFVGRGEPLKVDAIVVDLEGKAVPGRAIAMAAERLEWKLVGREWKETAAESLPCSVTSADDAVACTFRPGEGGSWRITARVTDEKDRPNETQMRVWVAGDRAEPARGVEQQSVTLIPDKKEYRAGETARVLVVAPFAPAEAVVSLRRSGVVKTERFRMDGATHTLTIPIEEAWTPNIHVQVDLVGRAARAPEGAAQVGKGLSRPAFASGTLSLPIPPLTRTLAVAATPRDTAIEPGGKTTVDLVVKDAAGRPLAGAEVALVVVDEAVLSLTGYKLPDPVAAFYAQREPGARDQELRGYLVLARPQDSAELALNGVEGGVAGGVVGGVAYDSMAQTAPAAPPATLSAMRAKRVGGLMEVVSVMAAEAAPIRARTDFAALAHFAPSVVTDDAGRAQVPITVPDNLTRYRIMAAAATTGREFGKGESVLTARLPLMVRASPPRFLNDGDRFELPVVLQNQTGQAMAVDVAVRATNAAIVGPRGQRVTVPANDRVEVRFPAAAARPGTARFQIAAASGRFADASEHALPVWTPATTEAFAAYGVVDQGAVVQPVKAPRDVLPDYGGLEVTTTSTALATLTDAVLYLVAYPFECTEQVSSRVLGVAGLRDVLTAFAAKGLPEPKALQDSMTRDIALLRRLQNDDGGWPFWRRGDESWPYVSIHVAHALQRAKEKGYAVPDETLKQALAYLKSIESRYPSWYGPDVRRTLTAYALYVRSRLGDRDPGRARTLVQEAGLAKLRLEAIGWLLPVLAKDPGSVETVQEIRRHLDNRSVETGATAHFVDDYGDQGAHVLLHSDRRADAVILESLIADQPQSDLIPKLVEGLLGHRRKGRWENTQENAFVLLALDRYFQTYEKTTPDFVARLWLGESFVGEHAYRGRTADRQHVNVPMRVVAARPNGTDLTIAKEGAGRLYYRIGMQYAPNDRKIEPADHGFTVERIYEAVDDPRDVRRDADGTWRIRAGARVRVRVTMVTTSRRYHVALVDPLPAGLEPLNPELATTGRLTTESSQTVDEEGGPGLGLPGHWWWWRRVWYEHENLRDERVEAFASLVWEGAWTYRYQARATTPGRFVVPPPKAEEMYHPETFGRGGSAVVVVE